MKSLHATLLFLLSWTSAMATQQNVTLLIPGMNCAACPITVRKALEKVDGVTAVQVDLDTKQAIVTFDDAKAAIGKLTEATTHAGYPASVVQTAQ